MQPERFEELVQRNQELQDRLDEAEKTLRAIRNGEVDAVVAAGPDGDAVYTLKGADESYRLLVEQMGEGAMTLTTGGLILFANEQLAGMLGLPLDRVIGSQVQDLVAQESRAVLEALLWSNDRVKGELWLKSAGGELVPVYLAASRLRSDEIACISIIVTDLTAQKRNEEIVAAGKLARSILEHAATAILVVNTDGRIVEANPAAEQLARMPVLLRSFSSVFPLRFGPESKDLAFEEILSTARRQGSITGLQTTVKNADGDLVPIILNAGYLASSDSKAQGCTITLIDVSELKRSEEALLASEARWRALLESASQGVVAVDESGRIVLVNVKTEEMFGYKRDELLGQSLGILLPERFRKAHAEHVPHYFARPQTRVMGIGLELHGLSKDGTEFPVEISLSAIEQGGSRLAMALITDITERKKAEERLWQAQKLESIGMLAGGVAHDFNNLLVGVIGNTSLAIETLPEGHESVELLQGVLKTGEQLAHLTRQMLAYSGKGRFIVEPLDLSDLIPEISGLVQPSIPRKVATQFDLDPHLPLVEADRGQMQQVFMNLVLNAAEAIGSKGGLISVKTRLEEVDEAYKRRVAQAADLQPGKYVALEVRDTGCGMDEATKARIFDPFFSTKFTGRGLGLAAVAGIVRGHKGAISVSSAPGKGTCFTVLLPAARGEVAPVLLKGRRAALQGSGTVLIVDDESTVRELAKKTLERYGYKVLVADSGTSAIDIFKRHPGEIAVVLLDLSMPEMGGEETLPELRKIRPEVNVIVSSGYSETETRNLFRGQRISGFIQKPYTSNTLAEKVKTALG